MSRVADQIASLWLALAFLLVGVPLAGLLDRLGFFEAAATWTGRGSDTPVLALWVLAALTTVVLNLDATVVLLAPCTCVWRFAPVLIQSYWWRFRCYLPVSLRRCCRSRTRRRSSSRTDSTCRWAMSLPTLHCPASRRALPHG